MQTPDVTKVQVISLVQAVVAAGLALGLNIPSSVSATLIASAGLIALVLNLADALIRGKRTNIAIAETQAKAAVEGLLHQLGAQAQAAAPQPAPAPPAVANPQPAASNPAAGQTS